MRIVRKGSLRWHEVAGDRRWDMCPLAFRFWLAWRVDSPYESGYVVHLRMMQRREEEIERSRPEGFETNDLSGANWMRRPVMPPNVVYQEGGSLRTANRGTGSGPGTPPPPGFVR